MDRAHVHCGKCRNKNIVDVARGHVLVVYCLTCGTLTPHCPCHGYIMYQQGGSRELRASCGFRTHFLDPPEITDV